MLQSLGRQDYLSGRCEKTTVWPRRVGGYEFRPRGEISRSRLRVSKVSKAVFRDLRGTQLDTHGKPWIPYLRAPKLGARREFLRCSGWYKSRRLRNGVIGAAGDVDREIPEIVIAQNATLGVSLQFAIKRQNAMIDRHHVSP